MSISVLDHWLEPVITPDVARRLLAVQTDPALEARIEELGARANEARLTESERSEYEQFVSDNDLIAILQAKARKVLRSRQSR